MVVFFTSTVVDPPATIYMGKDKVENEDLIKYGLKDDIWWHVDKLSSAHVYVRLPPGKPYGDWDALPEKLLVDLGQLVKANSIEGNKKNNVTIIYTPHSNLKKTGDMATGAVSFHSDRLVRRVYISARDNAVVNRLNKTKVVKDVDHEEERIQRLREEGKVKALKGNELKNARLAEERARAELRKNTGYASLFTEEAGYGVQHRPGLDTRFSSSRENKTGAGAGAGKAGPGAKGKSRVDEDFLGVGDGAGDGDGDSDEEGSQDDFW